MTRTVTRRRALAGGAVLLAAGLLAAAVGLPAGAREPAKATAPDGREHAMFGGTPARNMVDLKNQFAAVQLLPVKDGDKVVQEADAAIKWQAELGSVAYGGPVVAGGKVFVGTNNERPRNKRDTRKNEDGELVPVDKGILMCFDAATGKFLWQAVHDKLPSGLVHDYPEQGVCSAPVVEGNRLYYVSNRCAVVCADVNGLADGNQGPITNEKYQDPTDADFIWELDMMAALGVFPHNLAACCPLIVGDILYVVTSNGVDEGHRNVPAPQAPSFIALDKHTGKVLWKRNDPGARIMHGQWSNPTYAEINGVRQVIFPGGDGVLRAYKPETGELLWLCDCNPKDAVYELGGTGTRSDFIATPVVYDNKVYIGLGQDPEHFTAVSHFWCIDPAKATKPGMDISPELGEWGKPGKPNPDSGIVWHYGGPDTRPIAPRDFVFGRTMSTAAIVDGIVYISELQGFLHCLDAKTGKKFWQYDLKSSVWGSPYYVDGKVYVATEGGDVYCFKHEKAAKVIDPTDLPGAKTRKEFLAQMKARYEAVAKEYLLGRSEFDSQVRSTPVVADGVMYVMGKSLYAFEPKKK